ncbi:hypothetical protein B7P43_G07628 [Cryptotermes secundus]|uniref:F-box domain-containing protein n=1 Tax=Cryptotermes secundus TaxID=105785 RepID=A0A2J7RLD6_9NEOP|nr:F-box/WD repeat-containing protein 9 [Cryptotermes secundus]PNF41646.1 hypothetical protein B7P43_G07628 [Cryptotermes secundus]
MCDVSAVQCSDINVEQWSLENIPVEIFLHICSYLDARFISRSLSLVCKRFHEILSDITVWRSRITKRWGNEYPPVPVDTDAFDWRLACVCIEDQYEFWNKKDVQMKPILTSDIHQGAVNAVHLMNSGLLCVSGSKDRSIVLWDLSNVVNGDTEVPYQISSDVHKGWVTKLASCGETLYSCSFDTTVRSWQLTTSLQRMSAFQCRTPVLSLDCTTNLVAAGTLARDVMLFDTRVGQSEVSLYRAHRGGVLALSMFGNLIVSASEDRTLTVWDRRAEKVMKQLILYDVPLCMSFSNNLIYVGDSKGNLHLINPAQGHFNIVDSYKVGHRARLTCVQHGMGSILTSSTDGTVRISTPTQRPETITVISSQVWQVTEFDYKNDILVVGGYHTALEVWLPCGE